MIRLTRNQVREIDRRSIDEYHIPGIVLMENAARALTDAAIQMLEEAGSSNAIIVCGGGNNGGDGLALARHLHNRNIHVSILLTADPAKYTGDALINWRIVQSMGLPVAPMRPLDFKPESPALLVDAIFGTGLTQPPRDPFNAIVDAMHASQLPILCVDLPSGLDCDTGQPLGPACIKARRTVTFVAEKTGFANPAAAQYLGHVTIGDIGCPQELIARV